MDRFENMEVELAHLRRVSDELSDQVADQANRIAQLERRFLMLAEREMSREQDAGGGVYLGDQKPPHW